MGGSLYLTNVNGQKVKPQLIFGVPKLAYPYTADRYAFSCSFLLNDQLEAQENARTEVQINYW
jgi:hypothetical protein